MDKTDYEKLMQEKWVKATLSFQKAEESLDRAQKLLAEIKEDFQKLSSSLASDNLSSCS